MKHYKTLVKSWLSNYNGWVEYDFNCPENVMNLVNSWTDHCYKQAAKLYFTPTTNIIITGKRKVYIFIKDAKSGNIFAGKFEELERWLGLIKENQVTIT